MKMIEKPIRIIENDKIRGFNDKVQHGIEHALNFMLSANDNVNTQVSYFDPFLMPIEAYLEAYKRKSVMIKIYVENAFQSEVFLFFELKTAILLGAMLRMVTASSIEEKLAKELFDDLDKDGFGEVGNQLCGILDRAFRTLTNKNIHLRMDFEKRIIGADGIKDPIFPNKEEYVVLLSTITIPKHVSQKFTILLPRSLYEIMLNLEIQLQGINPKIIYLYSWNEALAEDLRKKINSRYAKLLMVKAPEDLFTLADSPNVAAVAMDLQSINFPLNHQDTIFIKRIASQKNLAKVPFFFSFGNSTDDQVRTLKSLNLTVASTHKLEEDFISWAQVYLQDPSKI